MSKGDRFRSQFDARTSMAPWMAQIEKIRSDQKQMRDYERVRAQAEADQAADEAGRLNAMRKAAEAAPVVVDADKFGDPVRRGESRYMEGVRAQRRKAREEKSARGGRRRARVRQLEDLIG